MVKENIITSPRSLEEFKDWNPQDGFKYEWYDGEIIKFEGMKKKEFYIYLNLLEFFVEKGLIKLGGLVAEQDVDLSPMQMRRPDIAFFTKGQGKNMKEDVDEVPQFTVEIISKNDNFNNVEAKLEEYFKYGVMVVWIIIPELKKVKVYNSLKENKNCFDNDICSANSVLPEFEMTVNQIFA
ncbi:MAG: Uma2 family endonuclease [Spirosomataceae bacterium]|jgi:Uma2 family endonuclease